MLTYDEGLRLATAVIASLSVVATLISAGLVYRSNRLARDTSARLEAMKLEASNQLEAGRQAQALQMEAVRQEQAKQLELSRQEGSRQVEILRTDLRTYSYRQEVQYSKLYEKRMALFGEMYALAWDVQGSLQAWMNEYRRVRSDEAGGDLQEAIRIQKAREHNEMVEGLNNLIRLVNRNVLYLPEAQATRLLAIVAHMRKASFTYTQWDFMERRNNLTDEQAQKIWDARDTAEKMVREQLDALLAEFLKDARDLLEERRS